MAKTLSVAYSHSLESSQGSNKTKQREPRCWGLDIRLQSDLKEGDLV